MSLLVTLLTLTLWGQTRSADFFPVSQSIRQTNCFAEVDSWHCPSAFAATERPAEVLISTALSGNSEWFDTGELLIDGDLSADEFDDLVKHPRNYKGYSAFEVVFRSPHFFIQALPWQQQVSYEVSNPALPTAEVTVVERKELILGLRTWNSQRWSSGVNLRFSERRISVGEIDVFEWAADGSLPVMEQQAILLEPSVGFEESHQWSFYASLHDIGWVDEELDEWQQYPTLLTGMTYISDPTWLGVLRVTSTLEVSERHDHILDSLGLLMERQWTDHFRTGATFSRNVQTLSLTAEGGHARLALDYEDDHEFGNSLGLQLGVVF